ncbi:ABC transporter ATP-binding protein [Hungatella sp.]|uniref:ABC transporter ATP-binding protein n=1 Tax=Hungatella sp. TaxID=2613924 RepID=UPI002A7EE9E5|nr:ABC transporter ATP-binding protein [Hungatella sp.]
MEREYKIRLDIQNISKSFSMENGKNHEVVRELSLTVRDNEFLILLGPGHCGKTVILNMIAGLMQPDYGNICLDGKNVVGPNPDMGMVFQKIGTLPWKTVMENVELGSKMRGIPKRERREKAQHYIDLVGLHGFEEHLPKHLSGGMKQRVGIARAYANDPQILLLDEPFGQLDAQTRYNMEEEIARIWEQEKRTILFVTNNIEEALMLGDRIILLTECPARVKQVYQVDLPRPRDMMDCRFLQMRREISENTDLSI